MEPCGYDGDEIANTNIFGGDGVCRVLVGGSVFTMRKYFENEQHFHASHYETAKRPDEDLSGKGLRRLAFEALNLSHQATLKIATLPQISAFDRVHEHGDMTILLRITHSQRLATS